MTARVLVVDDVAANTAHLRAKLLAEYFQVETANDGLEAMRLAGAWQPDLILLNVMMPGMDGFQTCRRLKSDQTTLHIPVVMVTALGDRAERLRGLEAGADDFLTKPVDDETLIARVRSLGREKRALDEWRERGARVLALGLSDAQDVRSDVIAGSKALVVDDWDMGSLELQETLSHEGIITIRAATQAESLALCEAHSFDLILLSLSVLGHDPLQLLARLRLERPTRDIPILLVAESEQRDRLLRGLDLGANDWVQRPVVESELRVRARNQVRRKRYKDRMRSDLGHALELALTDPLTGLHNHRYLMRHLDSLRASGETGVALLMVDIDHFKFINDCWGHAAGDKVLRQVAQTLRGRARSADRLARYGGEEFVLVMANASAIDAARIAERLRSAVEAMECMPNGLTPHRLTVSIGVSHYSQPAYAADGLLKAADQALYRAKRLGRNRVEVDFASG